jgi:hypothetical protein
VVTRGELASAELRLRLGALLRGIRPAVDRRIRRTAALAQPDISHLAITQQHAHVVLQEAEEFASTGRAYGPGTALTEDEAEMLDDLAGAARDAGMQLPGQVLRERGLSELDVEVLLLTAGPALEPSFATLYGFVHDAMSAVAATPYLAVEVLATDCDHERRVVEACGPFGTLRHEKLVTATGLDRAAMTPLRPAEGVAELLWGASIDCGLVGHRMARPSGGPLPAGVDVAHVTRLAAALRAGRLDVAGVWGPAGGGGRAVVTALLADAPVVLARAGGLDAALQRASMAGAVCVVAMPPDHDAALELAGVIAVSSATVIMHGEEPVRTSELLVSRRFAELRIRDHRFADRRATWSGAFPDLDADGIDDLAARFRLRHEDVEAVASLHRAWGCWVSNGHRPKVDILASLVSRQRSPQVATIRTPDRGPEMLVLPPGELAQVTAIAAAIRSWPRIAEDWRLDRFGNPGVTALFAGDPGTGKTLAAEVIATSVGLDLMVVDLSRLVSKWIGETEKNLDAVFSEAEASNCVLFFDEADSIFGQRGEVERGADRYANLEVGYLLQRLERYEGLVILASNLRANLDPAFTRRFHHVVHFPRPAEAERRRLWELALAPPVRLAGSPDTGQLATLDLTGAGIAAIVRSAALAVHADGRESLTAADIVAATSAQYRREARLLPREQLGPYAELMP